MSISKKDILDEATQVVAGRGKSYGAPEDNFQRIARLWNAHLRNRYPDHIVGSVGFQLDAQDVAMMMALMKIARLANDPNHHDSWVDVAGYAACGGEIAGRAREPAAEEHPASPRPQWTDAEMRELSRAAAMRYAARDVTHEDAADELLRRARGKNTGE